MANSDDLQTGIACHCADCQGMLLEVVTLSYRGRAKEKRLTGEYYCPDCGCRWQGSEFHPCANHADPRTGIRSQIAPIAYHSTGYVMLDAVALERLSVWFPGEYPSSQKMRPVLREIDLYVRLLDLFPGRSVDQLIAIRGKMRPFCCPRCGQPVDWRIVVDRKRAQAARVAYHQSLEEAL